MDPLYIIGCRDEGVCMEGVGCHVLFVFVVARVLFLDLCPCKSFSIHFPGNILSRSPLFEEIILSIHIFLCIIMLLHVVSGAQLVKPKRANSWCRHCSATDDNSVGVLYCGLLTLNMGYLFCALAVDNFAFVLMRLRRTFIAFGYCVALETGIFALIRTSLLCAMICAQQHPSFDCCKVCFDSNRQNIGAVFACSLERVNWN